jgi:hypothetical protein
LLGLYLWPVRVEKYLATDLELNRTHAFACALHAKPYHGMQCLTDCARGLVGNMYAKIIPITNERLRHAPARDDTGLLYSPSRKTAEIRVRLRFLFVLGQRLPVEKVQVQERTGPLLGPKGFYYRFWEAMGQSSRDSRQQPDEQLEWSSGNS